MDTFCICSWKNGGKWCLCFNTSCFTYFWYSLWRKLTKRLALHDFREILTHAIWLISPDTPRFCSAIFRKTESSWFFLLMQNPEKRPDLQKLVFIECLNFEKAIRFKYADKCQTTVHYGLLKVGICQKRGSTLFVR